MYCDSNTHIEQPSPEQPSPEQPSPEQPSPEQPSPEQPSPEQSSPEQPSPEQPSPKHLYAAVLAEVFPHMPFTFMSQQVYIFTNCSRHSLGQKPNISFSASGS